MRRTTRAVLLLALALLGAACGGDDDPTADSGGGDARPDTELTTEEQAYADAFAEDFVDDEDGLGVSAQDAQCLATVLMAELGTEPFDEAQVTPEDVAGDETPGQLLGEGAVTAAEAGAIYTGWEECVDLNTAFADSFQAEYQTDDATRECFRAGMADDDLLRDYMVASFTSGEELVPSEPPLKELVSLIARCTASDTGGSGGALVDSIAESLAADGSVTDEQAQCLAQSIVDTIGADKLLEGAGHGDLAKASPEVQQAVVEAITGAAAACGVPLSQLGGG
jgi:hypothetical protein